MKENNILFEHKLSVSDLKTSFYSFLFVFLFLFLSSFSIFFTKKYIFHCTFSFINIKIFVLLFLLYLFLFILFIFFEIKAKIILTEDGIYYKPPLLRRIYEMKYSSIVNFSYRKSVLFVYGKNNQQLKLFLAKDIAKKILDILEEKYK